VRNFGIRNPRSPTSAALEHVEHLQQGRLTQGHRVAPLYETLDQFTQRLTPMTPPNWSDTPDKASTYTTSRDVTLSALASALAHPPHTNTPLRQRALTSAQPAPRQAGPECPI
jgi:hypothetical protein